MIVTQTILFVHLPSAGVWIGIFGVLVAATGVGITAFLSFFKDRPLKKMVKQFWAWQLEAEAKHGILVEIQKPIAAKGDNPAVVDRAWEQFTKEREERRQKNNPPWRS